MIRFFWKGRKIPEYVLKVVGEQPDSVIGKIEYNGYGIIWKYKGKLYAKLFLGKSLVKCSCGVSLTLINKIDVYYD